MGTLYVVATPIGNLEDITLRAIRVLQEVNLIAAEDTRTTRVLLRKHGIGTRLVSYNEHNMRHRTPQLMTALETGDVALVSEAGTPGVSDPGHELIATTIATGYAVISIPGPSAVITALVVSGMPMRQFSFLGFLPRRAGERRRALNAKAREPRTTVFFESPYRLRATLEGMGETFGDRPIAVCRELTKTYEEIFRGTASEALAHFQEPRGEFTIVVEGASPDGESASETEVRAELERLRAGGATAKDAVAAVAARFGAPKREVYRIWLEVAATRPPTRKARRPSAQ